MANTLWWYWCNLSSSQASTVGSCKPGGHVYWWICVPSYRWLIPQYVHYNRSVGLQPLERNKWSLLHLTAPTARRWAKMKVWCKFVNTYGIGLEHICDLIPYRLKIKTASHSIENFQFYKYYKKKYLTFEQFFLLQIIWILAPSEY